MGKRSAEFLLEWQKEAGGERKRREPQRRDWLESFVATDRNIANLEEGVRRKTGNQQPNADGDRAFGQGSALTRCGS